MTTQSRQKSAEEKTQKTSDIISDIIIILVFTNRNVQMPKPIKRKIFLGGKEGGNHNQTLTVLQTIQFFHLICFDLFKLDFMLS